MTPLELVVRGRASGSYPAERATVNVAVSIEGTDRETVYRNAVRMHEPLTGDLGALLESGAVAKWSSNQLRVFSFRPSGEGSRRLRYRVAVKVEAEFLDFEALSGFLDRWAVQDGVDVGYTAWDVTKANRVTYEALLRREAVADATAKAQAFADAAGRGAVTAVQLADPGMLGNGSGEAQYPVARAMFAAPGGRGGGDSLELRPDDIELDVSVDARFIAE